MGQGKIAMDPIYAGFRYFNFLFFFYFNYSVKINFKLNRIG